MLHYSPLQVGLALLPGNVLMMVFSLGLSAKLVMRYGFRKPLAFGLAVAALALVWFARAPVHGSFLVDVLPAMLLIGVGGGLDGTLDALTGGYHVAFAVGALFALAAAGVGATALRTRRPSAATPEDVALQAA